MLAPVTEVKYGAEDRLALNASVAELETDRIDTSNTRGTGSTFAAAAAAG